MSKKKWLAAQRVSKEETLSTLSSKKDKSTSVENEGWGNPPDLPTCPGLPWITRFLLNPTLCCAKHGAPAIQPLKRRPSNPTDVGVC